MLVVNITAGSLVLADCNSLWFHLWPKCSDFLVFIDLLLVAHGAALTEYEEWVCYRLAVRQLNECLAGRELDPSGRAHVHSRAGRNL